MDINNLGQIYDAFRVLEVFAQADAHEALFWKFETAGELKMFANCSDTFTWGSADLEEITPETVGVLEQAEKDLQGIAPRTGHFLPELYASRVRKMRPMRAYYRMVRSTYPDDAATAMIELFNACGPERKY
jgi:hypothetical protein